MPEETSIVHLRKGRWGTAPGTILLESNINFKRIPAFLFVTPLPDG